ncbi:glycosyl transferase [Roseivivax halodurans JCM 10272]|uniref:Glycosyl transferase n=1 Tax=Roseivivax halodurans JCM 10272 TaxID=1449350 RepID=X7ED88_9RHOB|nr:glycosyltransferase family 2 protein [Roseivivax halodurans]ETX13088.1 glycosyl transferase [Roseivivax halodurans JCM 10272]
MTDILQDPDDPAALPLAADRGRPMASLLMDRASLGAAPLLAALAEAETTGAPLDRVVTANGIATARQAQAVRARHLGLVALDPAVSPPDRALEGWVAPEYCLRHRVLPWAVVGDTMVLAASDLDNLERARVELLPHWPRILPALVLESDIESELAARHAPRFARAAECAVPDDQSCRDLNLATPERRMIAAAAIFACTGALLIVPSLFFATVTLLALAAMLASQALKLAAALAAPRETPEPPALIAPYPLVTLLVPLFREAEIADMLVRRLRRLTYPKSALDVILILEEEDAETRALLGETKLPHWIRVIEVPKGELRTKPRALNYARHFARGEIIGILDAEDAPAANQVERMVARFRAAPRNVACLQGILDYYNPHANWLSRLFTVEYATWFRLVLPGLARLGLVVPLGGTTLYLRRDAIDAVGGWDAHNVTEDADLGLRLARAGYRTELVATVTLEEANNRAWPWIRQRSRWIKGYVMTWAAHTRHPAALLRDLGPWRTLGVQVLFLGSVAQSALAPALWSFWLVIAGLPHPVADLMGQRGVAGLVGFLLAGEAITLGVAFAALSRTPHSGLKRWVPTLVFYFPLSVAACWKALIELVYRPFYWDKTVHGASPPDHDTADRAPH